MKWRILNPYTLTCGMFNITKPKYPEKYPTPYGLWQKPKQVWQPWTLMGHYKTADHAKAIATEMIASTVQDTTSRGV